jgi:hypothetical protein
MARQACDISQVHLSRALNELSESRHFILSKAMTQRDALGDLSRMDADLRRSGMLVLHTAIRSCSDR